MKKIHCLFAILIMGIGFSCEKVLDVDLLEGKPIPVLYGVFTPDSTWTIDLSQTASVLDNYPLIFDVNNAVVSIHDDGGKLVEILSYYPKTLAYNSYSIHNNYRGKTSPQSGQRYSIKVEMPDKSILTASGKVPYSVPITSIEIDSSLYDSQQDIQLTLAFDDPREEKNFYQIKILRKRRLVQYSYSGPQIVKDSTVIYTEDIFRFNSIGITDEIKNGKVFSDKTFNGKNNTIRLTVGGVGGYNVNKPNPNPIRLVLTSVTEEYYNYFSGVNLAYEVRENPLAQPVQIYTNIENGLGLFTGYVSSEVELK